MAGFSSGYYPKFVKKYADLQTIIGAAVRKYADEIKRGVFPDESHSYHRPAKKKK